MAMPPTIETVQNDQFNSTTAPKVYGPEEKIINALESYRIEAENARRGGLNNRDTKWKENQDLYWNRFDFSRKKAWQAKETMPEVPSYVDRFAASLKEALVAIPEGFYTVLDPADQEGDLAQAIKRATDVWLSRAGRNQMGSLLPFSSVFEEQMKLGALMACSSVVTWKDDIPGGRVAIETVDPNMVFLDPTYRNLYRLRRTELDLHDVKGLVNQKDSAGRPIFNLPEIERLIANWTPDEQARKEELVGHGLQVSSGRTPIVLDEYIATVVDEQGSLLAERALMVVANNKYLVRGPEKNPFWHGNDWLIFAPMVTSPLSVYGRSYMEDFGSIAKTFTELTNMLLDAVHTSSLKAFAVVPDMLINPGQLAEGITPNKMFQLEQGFRASDFASALELGNLPPDSIRIWSAMKDELAEAARLNEIGLGQFAPKGRTSATEITETQQSSSALIRSIAQTIETRYLDPTLDLTWKTGFQHIRAGDKRIKSAVGEEMFDALVGNKRELISRPFTFQARGISTIIQRSQLLKSLIAILQLVGSNEALLREFMKVVDMEKFVKKLFELSGIDLNTLQLSEREKMIRSVTQPMQGLPGANGEQPGGPGGGPGAQEMANVARTMGISR